MWTSRADGVLSRLDSGQKKGGSATVQAARTWALPAPRQVNMADCAPKRRNISGMALAWYSRARIPRNGYPARTPARKAQLFAVQKSVRVTEGDW